MVLDFGSSLEQETLLVLWIVSVALIAADDCELRWGIKLELVGALEVVIRGVPGLLRLSINEDCECARTRQ